jgi:hypothetical protein
MDQASNLRAGYRILEDNITVALQTKVGDRQRLSALRDDALMFMVAVDNVSDRDVQLRLELMSMMKHKDLFPSEELELVASNIKAMVELLDGAEGQSLDPPTEPAPSPSHLNYTGTPGRPRIEIEPGVLSSVLSIEPKTTLATMLGCSARTVRRRQKDIEHQTGVPLAPQRSTLPDNELDGIVGGILAEFPHYGRSMLMGAMTFQGHNVPERRVRESLDRVRGAPGRFFGSRPIHRRKYFVPAANSLWHHDGQHGALRLALRAAGAVSQTGSGLIRWKLVIHGFIDGKTRFVVGLRAHNNNRAATVLRFFSQIISVHGCPSRVRGDHGVENGQVADYMEERMGPNRGSYIWGR